MKQKALSNFFLFFSITFFSTGLFLFAFAIYRHNLAKKKQDAKYHITKIIQTTYTKEQLTNDFLAKLLGLSSDHPINLYQFSEKKAKAQLENFYLIKNAFVKKK